MPPARVKHWKNSWIKTDQLDITCFIISLFNTQHVSDVSTSNLRSLRLIFWVIAWVVLFWFDVIRFTSSNFCSHACAGSTLNFSSKSFNKMLQKQFNILTRHTGLWNDTTFLSFVHFIHFMERAYKSLIFCVQDEGNRTRIMNLFFQTTAFVIKNGQSDVLKKICHCSLPKGTWLKLHKNKRKSQRDSAEVVYEPGSRTAK